MPLGLDNSRACRQIRLCSHLFLSISNQTFSWFFHGNNSLFKEELISRFMQIRLCSHPFLCFKPDFSWFFHGNNNSLFKEELTSRFIDARDSDNSSFLVRAQFLLSTRCLLHMVSAIQ